MGIVTVYFCDAVVTFISLVGPSKDSPKLRLSQLMTKSKWVLTAVNRFNGKHFLTLEIEDPSSEDKDIPEVNR